MAFQAAASSSNGGSGGRLGGDSSWPIVVAGIASGFATVVSLGSLWTHLKQYRKPIMQRYVVRIMLMVPLYSIASWLSLLSFTAASFIDPIRDVYEAFVIYCFFQLLVNYLGGERSIIISTHGRLPKDHPWPMNYLLSPCDISDPYTFLTIKRGILQYAWLKPLLALATVIMKATGTFQEGYIGLTSGYMWSGIIYNISITVSLYCLAMFWVCLHEDLVPFRPVPKFLVIKLVIFASYWQGFLLSLLVYAGLIKDSPGYSSDNISLAIQDLLTCLEMPIFAVAHWYAFDVIDYTDPTIASARMPIAYAARDSFGALDLIVDSRDTLFGKNYGYRLFDPGENLVAPADEHARMSRIKEGMRYKNGGRGRHWVPQPGRVNDRTPLLDSAKHGLDTLLGSHSSASGKRFEDMRRIASYNAEPPVGFDLDDQDEELFKKARTMEFGDYNSPSIEVRLHGDLSRARRGHANISTSSHQKLLREPPTLEETAARLREQGFDASSSLHGKKSATRIPLQSHPSRIEEVRDLVVEDPLWEERERMRIRREGPAPGFATHADAFQRFVHLESVVSPHADDSAQRGDKSKQASERRESTTGGSEDERHIDIRERHVDEAEIQADAEGQGITADSVDTENAKQSGGKGKQKERGKARATHGKREDASALAAVDSNRTGITDDSGDDNNDGDDADSLDLKDRLLGHDHEHVVNPWTS